MGRFKGNDATRGLQGNVGDFYNYRQRLGKTVTTRQVGKRTKPLNADQEQIKERFIEAAIYGKAVLKIPEKEALYATKKVPGKGVYMLAMTDYLKPPVIKSINMTAYTGVAGSTIIVRASDDFKVMRVRVSIYAASGALLEEGDTVLNPENGLDFIYTATAANNVPAGSRVKATAYDLPNNEGSLEILL